jgi:hypothetical protein
MTATNENFFDSIDGALTPEQAAQAFALAEQGDTGGKPDAGGAPTTTAATDNTSTTTATPTDNEQAKPADAGKTTTTGAEGAGTKDGTEVIDPANAVVLARDGKHTIPYDRLEKARQGEQHWKAQAEEAQRQLTDLRAKADARAEAGQAPTKTDNMVAAAEAAIEKGVDASLFGDFSEEALAAGIAKLVQQQVEVHVGKAVAPLQAKQQQDAATAHYDAIYKAHPNADSIVESAEFKAWVDAHPSAVRNAYWQLFDPNKGGTAAEIVEVFDAFAKVGKEAPTPAASDKAAATAAAASARVEPPASLSGIPGGRADGLSPQERMASMDGSDLYLAMESMSPAQIEAFLNKRL